MEEVSKLLVVLELLLFHRHDLLDVGLEVLQVLHQGLLLLLEVVDLVAVLCDSTLGQVVVGNVDVVLVELQQRLCVLIW